MRCSSWSAAPQGDAASNPPAPPGRRVAAPSGAALAVVRPLRVAPSLAVGDCGDPSGRLVRHSAPRARRLRVRGLQWLRHLGRRSPPSRRLRGQPPPRSRSPRAVGVWPTAPIHPSRPPSPPFKRDETPAPLPHPTNELGRPGWRAGVRDILRRGNQMIYAVHGECRWTPPQFVFARLHTLPPAPSGSSADLSQGPSSRCLFCSSWPSHQTSGALPPNLL